MVSASQIIANRYQLERQIGAGSYADTWLAYDRLLERKVAVKILRPQFQSRDEDLDQFRQEAHTAALISHPNVVATFDAGMTDGLAFMVMEYVDGFNLKQEIRARGRLDLQRALSVTDDLLNGLSRIHAAGIIHQDVKPQNVLVSPSGDTKLTDFGIARNQDESARTSRDTTMGSAAYMAPEQAQGHPVTPAADIYAVGVIMYEMLTGRLPFFGDDPRRVIDQHISSPVKSPRRFNPRVPIPVERVILRALSKQPADRYQSAEQMRYELLNAQMENHTRRAGAVSTAQQNTGGSRYLWVAAAAIMMLTLLAGSTAIAVRDFSTGTALSSRYFEAVEGGDEPDRQLPGITEGSVELILDYELGDASSEDEGPVDRPAPGGTMDESTLAQEPEDSEPDSGSQDGTDSGESGTGGTGGPHPETDQVPERSPSDEAAESGSEDTENTGETDTASEGDSNASEDDSGTVTVEEQDEPAETSEDESAQETPSEEQQEDASPDSAGQDEDGDQESEEATPDPADNGDDDQPAQPLESPDEEEDEQSDNQHHEENQEHEGEHEAADREEDEQEQDESGNTQQPKPAPEDDQEEESNGASESSEAVGGAGGDAEHNGVPNPEEWSRVNDDKAPNLEELTGEFWSMIEKYENLDNINRNWDFDDPRDPWKSEDDDEVSESRPNDSDDNTDDNEEDRSSESDDEESDDESSDESESDDDHQDSTSSGSDEDDDDHKHHDDNGSSGDDESSSSNSDRDDDDDKDRNWGDLKDSWPNADDKDDEDDKDDDRKDKKWRDRKDSWSHSGDDEKGEGDDSDHHGKPWDSDNESDRDDDGDDGESDYKDRSRKQPDQDRPNLGTFASYLSGDLLG